MHYIVMKLIMACESYAVLVVLVSQLAIEHQCLQDYASCTQLVILASEAIWTSMGNLWNVWENDFLIARYYSYVSGLCQS